VVLSIFQAQYSRIFLIEIVVEVAGKEVGKASMESKVARLEDREKEVDHKEGVVHKGRKVVVVVEGRLEDMDIQEAEDKGSGDMGVYSQSVQGELFF